MKKIALILPCLLVACASIRPTAPVITERLVPVRVEIPVVQPCVTEDIALPELMIGTLTDEDQKDPGKVVQFYVADVTQLKGIILRQKKLLTACRIIPEGSKGEAIHPVVPEAAKPVLPTVVVKPLPVPPEATGTPLTTEPPPVTVAPTPSSPPKPAPRTGARTFDPPPPPNQ